MSSLRARRNVVVPVAMVAALLAVLVGALLLFSFSDDSPAGVVTSDGGGSSGTALVVREDSHRLSTAPDGKVTFVEFLDFECEGCRAAYPVIEQLRKDYAGG